MGQVDTQWRRATVARLVELREAGTLTAAHVRVAASGHGVDERTVRRWLARADQDRPVRPELYRLSEVDREAYAFYRGNIAAIERARAAVLAGEATAAGVPVPAFLAAGWAGASAVTGRTLRHAYAREMTPAERAYWASGEAGRRAADVYLTRPWTPRNQWWEMDHKQLPILVLPLRGRAVCPWLTSVVDDGTRALLGWAITLTPSTATVLTALRMALVHDPVRGPFGAVPAGARVDRGLEFAAQAVKDALAALCVDPNRLPGFTPHRKGKIERLHQTIAVWSARLYQGAAGRGRATARAAVGPGPGPGGRRVSVPREGGGCRRCDLRSAMHTWTVGRRSVRAYLADSALTSIVVAHRDGVLPPTRRWFAKLTRTPPLVRHLDVDSGKFAWTGHRARPGGADAAGTVREQAMPAAAGPPDRARSRGCSNPRWPNGFLVR